MVAGRLRHRQPAQARCPAPPQAHSRQRKIRRSAEGQPPGRPRGQAGEPIDQPGLAASCNQIADAAISALRKQDKPATSPRSGYTGAPRASSPGYANALRAIGSRSRPEKQNGLTSVLWQPHSQPRVAGWQSIRWPTGDPRPSPRLKNSPPTPRATLSQGSRAGDRKIRTRKPADDYKTYARKSPT